MRRSICEWCCAIILEVINIATSEQLKCEWCKKIIKEDTLHVKHSAKKFYHNPCYESFNINKQNRKELLDYIIELQGHRKFTIKTFAQLKDFEDRYKMTYKGIELSLRYFYEIQGNSYDLELDGIGIAPYVYEKAKKFYGEISDAAQFAETNDYNPQEEVVYMNDPPQKRVKKLVNIEEITDD